MATREQIERCEDYGWTIAPSTWSGWIVEDEMGNFAGTGLTPDEAWDEAIRHFEREHKDEQANS